MTRGCSIADCSGPHYAKGWCFKHYQRVRATGTTNERPRRLCLLDECTRSSASVEGMCEMHLRRLRRTGFLDSSAARRSKWLAGFYEKLSAPTSGGCLEFNGTRDKDGYGEYGSGKFGPDQTHRLAWVLSAGPIPPGLWVLHRCDNPPCCNPEHLWLGTAKDNAYDMIAKGRAAWQVNREVCHQ